MNTSPQPRRTDSAGNQLPPGWEAENTPGGLMFYLDHNTHTTTWLSPAQSANQATSAIPNDGQQHLLEPDSDTRPLPVGWQRSRAADGSVYFIDHNRRQTQREDPRLQPVGISQNQGNSNFRSGTGQ